MKFKSTILASAAALLLANTASADFTVRLTGATAFRASAVNAIKNTMTFPADSGGVDYGYGYVGTSFDSSANQIFVGTMTAFPGQVVTVKCTWSGSVAGIRALSGNLNGTPFNVKFLSLHPAATDAVGTQYALSATGTASVNIDNLDDSAQADMGFADNAQSSSKYLNNSLDADVVGVVPFCFVASRDAPAGLTNITPQLAQFIYGNGFASAAMFTNNPADASNLVGGTMIYPMGRDPFSGTRVIVHAETGIGAAGVVNQWRITGTTGASPDVAASQIDVTAADATTDTLNQIDAGNNGDTSGSSLANSLRHKSLSVNDIATGNNSVKAAFIAYMGETDANSAVNGISSSVNGGANTNVGCRILTYNGVSAFGGKAYSVSTATTTQGSNVVTNIDARGLVAGQFLRSTTGHLDTDSIILTVIAGVSATDGQVTVSKNALLSSTGGASFQASNVLPQAIWNGSYTLWGYEVIMKRSSLTSGDKFTFYTNLKNRIHDTDYFYAGMSEGAMKVSRSQDGGTVGPKYDFVTP